MGTLGGWAGELEEKQSIRKPGMVSKSVANLSPLLGMI